MVGGHDHSLQILDGGRKRGVVVVSGSASNTSGVSRSRGTLFAMRTRASSYSNFTREGER
jgi:hypothetical protein